MADVCKNILISNVEDTTDSKFSVLKYRSLYSLYMCFRDIFVMLVGFDGYQVELHFFLISSSPR